MGGLHFALIKVAFAFVEYGGDKWYVKISNSSSQTDVLHEASYFPSSFVDYQFQVGFNGPMTESKLAFVDYTYEKIDDCHCFAHVSCY